MTKLEFKRMHTGAETAEEKPRKRTEPVTPTTYTRSGSVASGSSSTASLAPSVPGTPSYASRRKLFREAEAAHARKRKARSPPDLLASAHELEPEPIGGWCPSSSESAPLSDHLSQPFPATRYSSDPSSNTSSPEPSTIPSSPDVSGIVSAATSEFASSIQLSPLSQRLASAKGRRSSGVGSCS